jgi:hypothetical protein
VTSTERSDNIYTQYLGALQKFDYFVAGVSLALISFLGSAFHATRIGWNPATIELSSLLTLLISAIAGLKRIETQFTLLAMMHRRLYEQEAAGSLVKASVGGGPALNESTGEVLSYSQLVYGSHYHRIGAEVAKEKLDELVDRSSVWYRVRNLTLILGVALLILARLSQAYLS